MQPQDLILLDADFRPKGGLIDDVHVMYCFADKSISEDDDAMEHSDFPGHDFFNRWLPEYFQTRYGTLENYWRKVHVFRRNEHVKQYLIDRANAIMEITWATRN